MAKKIDLKRYKKVHSALKSEFEANWKDTMISLQSYYLPKKGENLDYDTPSSHGKQRYENVVHSEGVIAQRTLSDGISTTVTPSNKKWVALSVENNNLMEMAHVKEWLEIVEDEFFLATQQSNFYSVAHDVYSEMVVFGTGAAFIEEDFKTIIRLKPITMGTYYIGLGADGRVDTICREFKMRAHNVVEKFGINNVSDKVRAYVTGTDKVGDEWVDVRHIIEPNDDRDITKIDITNKPIRSIYYEADAQDMAMPLRSSGYDIFPVIVARWNVKGTESWGRSPGMDALPDVKELQHHKKAFLRLVSRMSEPSLLVDSKLKGTSALNLRRNGITHVEGLMEGKGRAVQETQTPSAGVEALLLAMEEVKTAIKSKMYADLFFIITQQGRGNETATEVRAKENEKFEALGRVMENLLDEFIHPAVDIIFEILFRNGRIPPPPEEMRGQTIKVDAISTLARAQRLSEITPMEQLLGFVAGLQQFDPSVVDKINTEQMVDIFARAAGVDSGAINSDEVVATLRAAQAAEIERQQRLVEQQAAVQNAQTMSQTDTSGDNLLTAAAGG